MYIDKIIKKEVTTLIISVGILLIVFIGVSFASFFKVDEGKENVVETGDLAISFCSDSTCDNTYENIGQVIGTTKQNGTSVPSSIYPYPDDGSYSNATPYIFKVTNTGSMDLTVTIKLKEDADFLPSGNYSEYSRLTDLYANHLKIAIRKVVLAPNSKYQLGDVNMDGIVNLDDSVYILEALAGTKTLTDEQTKLADVNKDGTVDGLDSVEVLRVIKGDDTTLEKTYINLFSELSNNIVCDNEKIAPGETSIFFLWLYLDETTPNQAQKTYFVGNLDIQGEYIPDNLPSFTDDSWQKIVENIKSGNGIGYKVGEEREVDLGTYGKHKVRIANNSTPDECNTEGFSQTACGFVLEFTDIITTHKMNDTATNEGGWPSTSMRTFLNNDIYNALPTELKNVIIDTNIVSGGGANDNGSVSSTDKIYLLAPTEIWGDLSSWQTVYAYDDDKNSTRQLDYYKKIGVSTSKYSDVIKYNGTKAAWWYLRTANKIGSTYFYGVNSSGNWSNSNANDNNSVSPAFRIG